MQVEVVAPRFVTQGEIQQLLSKRDNWIRKHLAQFQQTQTVQPEYISGEDCYYLGERYLLEVVAGDTDYAILKQGKLYIYCQDPTDWTRKQKIIEAFYHDKAQAYFHTILAKYQYLHNHDVVLRIKKMRTRWGSCNPQKGYINLNLALIQKPKRAIEYVILHEITHFTYPYHDREFYNYVSTYMPDWKQAKQQLENSGR